MKGLEFGHRDALDARYRAEHPGAERLPLNYRLCHRTTGQRLITNGYTCTADTGRAAEDLPSADLLEPLPGAFRLDDWEIG